MEKPLNARNAKLQAMDKIMDKVWKAKKLPTPRNAKLQAMDKIMDKVWKAKKLPTLYPQFCPQPSASISRHQ